MRFGRQPPSRLLLMLLLAGTGIVVTGCGDDDDEIARVSRVGAPASITIKLIAFQPNEVEVAVGATVTWLQEDVATHTVTSGTVETSGGSSVPTPDGRFDSGNITKGQQFEFTVSEPGDFPFFCAVHPATMNGVIHVQ